MHLRLVLLTLALALMVPQSGLGQEPSADDQELVDRITVALAPAIREAVAEASTETAATSLQQNPLALTWNWISDLSNGDSLSLIAVFLLLLERVRPSRRSQ